MWADVRTYDVRTDGWTFETRPTLWLAKMDTKMVVSYWHWSLWRESHQAISSLCQCVVNKKELILYYINILYDIILIYLPRQTEQSLETSRHSYIKHCHRITLIPVISPLLWGVGHTWLLFIQQPQISGTCNSGTYKTNEYATDDKANMTVTTEMYYSNVKRQETDFKTRFKKSSSESIASLMLSMGDISECMAETHWRFDWWQNTLVCWSIKLFCDTQLTGQQDIT